MNSPRKTTAAIGFGLRFLFRLTAWAMSAAVALVALLYFAMPALLRFGIPHALSRYGIDSSIESARVDIAEEKITLVGFNVGPTDGPGIRWGEVVALVDMTALMKGNIRIIDIQVKDARVDLQQLAAVNWKPAIAETDAGANPLQFDVGEAAIRDLEFTGLSKTLGRPVSLNILKVGSLSNLNRGDQVAFQLEASLGEAKLKLTGVTMMQGDLPIVEGRFEFGAFVLDGLSAALNLADGSDVRGRMDGSGTFTLRYQPENAVVKLGVSGLLAASGLALESPQITLTEAGIDWEGSLEMDWPVSGQEPSLRADGRAAAKRIVASSTREAVPLHFESEGIRWSGKLLFRNSLSFAGNIDADTVRVTGGQSTGGWRVDSNGVLLEELRRAENEDFRIGTASADEIGVSFTRENVEHTTTLASVSLSNLGSGGDGYTVGSVSFDSAESMAAESPHAARWKITGVGSSGIRISTDGELSIADLRLTQGQLDLPGMHVSAADARAAGIEGYAVAAWKVAEVHAASLRHRKDASEIWSGGLSIAGGRYGRDGGIAADTLIADRIRQSTSDVLDWEITSVTASAVSGTASAFQAERATASSFIHRIAASGEIEIDGAEISNAFYRKNIDTRASNLQFVQLRYRSGDIQSLILTESAAVEPSYSEVGRFSAESVNAKQLHFTDNAANTTRFDTISTSGIEGDLKSGVRVETATVDQWRHEGTGDVDVEGQSLQMRAVNATFEGAILADAATLDRLLVGLADDMNVSVAGLRVRGPKLQAADISINATGASASELGVRQGANRRFSVHNVEAGRIEPGPSGAHVLAYLRASRAEAIDEVIGTQLDVENMSLEALAASVNWHIKIGRGVFQRLSLADTRGTPAASFSAKDVTMEDGGFDPGKLIDLGHIRINDVSAVVGFSEFSRFVLPKVPFAGGAEKPTVELAVSRLETRGNGRLSFFDRSTAPPFELVLAPFITSLENYHSGDSAARASFTVDGKIDEFSTLKVNGALSQKPDGVDLMLEGKVTAFELKRLNTYAGKHTRSTLGAGRGDATFDIKINGQKLTGESQFVFSRVMFESAAEAAASANQEQNLSLDHAFAMLKDRDDIVKISVPLSGSLDDPQFDFSDGVTQAVIKTVQNAVMLTFKPLGLLVSVAGLVGVGKELRFNPVSFDAGEATLTGQSLTYLDNLAGQLEKRPKVGLKICGRAVPADLIVLENVGADVGVSNASEPPPAQKDLAENRATVVRRYLENKKGIASGRLLACPSKVESVAGGLPRAEMLVHVAGQPEPAAVQPSAKGTAN